MNLMYIGLCIVVIVIEMMNQLDAACRQPSHITSQPTQDPRSRRSMW
jgi:hypothetical protein